MTFSHFRKVSKHFLHNTETYKRINLGQDFGMQVHQCERTSEMKRGVSLLRQYLVDNTAAKSKNHWDWKRLNFNLFPKHLQPLVNVNKMAGYHRHLFRPPTFTKILFRTLTQSGPVVRKRTQSQFKLQRKWLVILSDRVFPAFTQS